MVMLSYWKPDRPLIDPFCGSGTIPIEAARIGRNMAPGREREFACEAWPDFPAELLAVRCGRPPTRRVCRRWKNGFWPATSTRRILKAARENAERAGVADDIHFQAKPTATVDQ